MLSQTSTETGLKKAKTNTHVVPSGKVYRQLFEAQVQLSDALLKTKEKQQVNKNEVRINDKSIPLIKESRGIRGNGILTDQGIDWINAETNELIRQNPIFIKYQKEKRREKPSKLKKQVDQETVNELPDEVVSNTKESNIETRLEDTRRKKHNSELEDMAQEIAMVNIRLEPQIKKIGEKLLSELKLDDKDLEAISQEICHENAIFNGSIELFDNLKEKLFDHGKKRKEKIIKMDHDFLEIENERTENIRSILSIYSEKLFRISYLPRPKIENLFDEEIQLLNQQILTNKKYYAELYAKLVTANIEKEKNLLKEIEQKLVQWQLYALDSEIKAFEKFIDEMDMLKLSASPISKIEQDQLSLNNDRLSLLNQLQNLGPPEATKPIIYKWFESIKEVTQKLKDANSTYVNTLRKNYEASNQTIIKQIESLLELLLVRGIVDKTSSKEILDYRLLPIWSLKQKQIEDHIETVETNLEELNEKMDKELYNLFKYVQGICHVWDTHEIGLLKKERSLQELLQDCRKTHDTDNQRREEKLDQILDQMRESSSEKDLKRLLSNVALQLDAIKRGYHSFGDAQIEILKQYPDMVDEELSRYRDAVRRFFLLDSDKEEANNENMGVENNTNQKSDPSIRQMLNDAFAFGSKVYVKTVADQVKSVSPEDIFENVSAVETTEFNKDFVDKVQAESYLNNCFIDLELFNDLKNNIRMNFLNHLETWLIEGKTRSNAIVVAKSDEIEKELELRLHLHEPRMKRAEMDVHNVRASELLIHEERVERHCAGIEEIIENMKKNFVTMQEKLVEMGERNKIELHNLEMAFINANKSIKIISLQEQLNKQREKHIEEVKTALRNFRAEIDDKLSYLRTSNAKFRCSFNVFSDGGNFSAEEIETYKKKLEKMAVLIDSNETHLLKEMEKLEKKYMDEVLKNQNQFQEKFKYNLGDLQFIEKIARWLSETQIKIKIDVNESNSKAKELSDQIKSLELKIDACRSPNLDKIKVKSNELMPLVHEINQLMYNRAQYLSCLIDERLVPIEFRQECFNEPQEEVTVTDKSSHKSSSTHLGQTSGLNQASLVSSTNIQMDEKSLVKATLKPKGHHEQSTNNITSQVPPNTLPKSSTKLGLNDDPALVIIKNILNSNTQADTVKEVVPIIVEQSINNDSTTHKNSKKQSKNSKASKLSNTSSSNNSSTRSTSKEPLLSIAQVKKIVEERKAKTRDEMYSYYLTFGEHKHPGNDFLSKIKNNLRESLEGILTNSEVFYRELQLQNRQVTYKSSLKSSYSEFAESIISKLKSYYSQCDKYRNQSLKEFRECIEYYELLVSQIPDVIIRDLFDERMRELDYETDLTRSRQTDELKRFETERVKNEASLRPNLGHPNMSDKLQDINENELKRQKDNIQVIESYTNELRKKVKLCSEKFLKELGKNNEYLLIKFDDLLCLEDIKMHDTTPEKLKTSELLKQRMLQEQQQTKREVVVDSSENNKENSSSSEEKSSRSGGGGKWPGVESSYSSSSPTPFESTINTLKATSAHRACSSAVIRYNQKYKSNVEQQLKDIDMAYTEMSVKASKWANYWREAVESIKNLFKEH